MRDCAHGSPLVLTDIDKNFSGEDRQMLVQAHEMRALIILIDGVDEAAGMKEAIEEFVHKEVAVSGNRVVVTSRPEGVRLELYEERFIVINLLKLSDEQQRKVISSQMKGACRARMPRTRAGRGVAVASSTVVTLLVQQRDVRRCCRFVLRRERVLQPSDLPLNDPKGPGRDLRGGVPS